MTYDDYKSIGGASDEATFTRFELRVNNIIKTATHNREIDACKEIAFAKRDIIDYLAEAPLQGGSHSRSAGSVSETNTYYMSADVNKDIDNILYDYLGNIKDKKGTPALYRGMR